MPVIVVVIGLLVGLALGALGGGGSILTVPALVHVLGQDPTTATTGSLVIVGITSLVGLVPHLREGRVRVAKGVVFGVLGVLGSVLGSRLSTGVDPDVLLAAFAVLMLVVAVVMVRRTLQGEEGGDDPGSGAMVSLHPWSCDCPRVVKLVVAASVVGLLTGFFGVGGGFVLVPALVLALGLPMPVAVGTSLLVIAINSAVALAARAGSFGGLDWGVIAVFTAAAIGGSLVGGRLAGRVDPRRLSLAFAALVVVIALYTAATSVPALV